MSKHKNLSTIEKLMDGFNPHRQRQEEARGLVQKWEPTGLLEGIELDTVLSNSFGFGGTNASIALSKFTG